MTEPITNFAATQALTLLTGYGFELKGYSASILIYKWLNHYQANWIRLAVVEALYQGRYKAISVEYILAGWQRRGQPNFHFSLEFERLICQNPFTSVTSDNNTLKKLPIQPAVIVSQLPSQTPARGSEAVATSNLPSLVGESISVPELKDTPIVEGESVISEVLVNPPEIVGEEPENRRTIQQFTPLLDNSEMYAKLRAVAHRQIMNKDNFCPSQV